MLRSTHANMIGVVSIATIVAVLNLNVLTNNLVLIIKSKKTTVIQQNSLVLQMLSYF